MHLSCLRRSSTGQVFRRSEPWDCFQASEVERWSEILGGHAGDQMAGAEIETSLN